MQNLYPFVRRVRRPLLVVESSPDGPPKPPVMVGNVEPVKAVAELGNIQQPTFNLEHPMGQPAVESETRNEENTTQADGR